MIKINTIRINYIVKFIAANIIIFMNDNTVIITFTANKM